MLRNHKTQQIPTLAQHAKKDTNTKKATTKLEELVDYMMLNQEQQEQNKEILNHLFGVNISMITEKENDWDREINELNKIPSYLMCNSKDDAMSCLNPHLICGVNSPQMYLKVNTLFFFSL